MKIYAGYKITYDCPQSTPMILQLSVHPSRTPDLLTWDRLQLDPPILANTYHDVFGNFCHVIHAPAGQLTMSADFLVQDKGDPDAVDLRAEQHASARPSGRHARLPPRQPILRDRSLHQYRMDAIRKHSQRMAPCSGDLRLRPRSH